MLASTTQGYRRNKITTSQPKHKANNPPKTPIQLIVGLCNPGSQYEATRHNAGAWFVEQLSKDNNAGFTLEKKFFGSVAKIHVNSQDVLLLLPNTFMNLSGKSIRAITEYYKIPIQNVLVAHDEIDLLPGDIKIKFGGGHAGHNGLRDIFQQLGGQKDFYRLRIGVGHPGRKELVQNYVLNAPSKHEQQLIDEALDRALHLTPEFITGDKEAIVKQLHT